MIIYRLGVAYRQMLLSQSTFLKQCEDTCDREPISLSDECTVQCLKLSVTFNDNSLDFVDRLNDFSLIKNELVALESKGMQLKDTVEKVGVSLDEEEALLNEYALYLLCQQFCFEEDQHMPFGECYRDICESSIFPDEDTDTFETEQSMNERKNSPVHLVKKKWVSRVSCLEANCSKKDDPNQMFHCGVENDC